MGVNFSHRPLLFRSSVALLGSLSVDLVASILLQNPPDLCIGMTTRPAVNLLLASVGCRWPVVVAERNYPPSHPQPLIWSLLRRFLYPVAALHVVQTQRIADWLHQSGLTSKSVVLPNPVVWPLPVQDPILQPDDFMLTDVRVVLAMGTKPFQKGFDRLLGAFQELAPSYPDLVLVLVGVHPDHPDLASPLERMGPLQTRIVLPGRVEILLIGIKGLICLYSARYEGSPNVLLDDGSWLPMFGGGLPNRPSRGDSPWRQWMAAPGAERCS